MRDDHNRMWLPTFFDNIYNHQHLGLFHLALRILESPYAKTSVSFATFLET